MEVQDLQDFSVATKHHSLLNLIGVFFRDIKLSHSVFALPFVGVALTLTGFNGLNSLQLALIVICMILARSFAMGMNRYLDRGIDALNARTIVRALPSGMANAQTYLAVTLSCGALFIFSAFHLSAFAGWLSPFLLLVLACYSLMKRLSWMTHWYLGLCLGLAPVAAEIALFGQVTAKIILIGLAVAFWTAGFDLLYSLQDREFDVGQGLHSVPARFGYRVAIWLSRLSFMVMIFLLLTAGVLAGAGIFWWIGVAFVAGILFLEHWLIRDAMVTGSSDMINAAFFNLNALVSVVFLTFAILNAYAKNL
jgi:4-hydroxybenzoate polyprenyltransferase